MTSSYTNSSGMMGGNIEAIARGLSKAQREMIAKGEFPAWMRERRESRVKSALVKKGCATFHHVIAGRGDFFLTPLGAAVRAHILDRSTP